MPHTSHLHPLYVVLSDIRSTHNVGSILRSADGAGASGVYLCGRTPTPIDRFGRKRRDIAKTSLGAEDMVPWEYVEDIHALIARLKSEGVRVIGVEQSVRSARYNTLAFDTPTACLFGEEVYGLPDDILALCDCIAEIPMHGKKESLNVSVAAGIVLYRLIESS